MLQLRSILKVTDNTGAKKLMIIQFPGRGKKKATIGDIVTCVVKEASPESTIKTHQVVKAVIVRTKKEVKRLSGDYIRFDDNAAVIIDNLKDKNPKGTRIIGPVAREIKALGLNKIVSLAKEVY